ncbi:hypothetical protein FBU30_004889 [Linnemannia zychae]|nr:hypothetical protein FBU30_004889 [Linnemannia zychae]
MKIITLSAVLCLAASVMAVSVPDASVGSSIEINSRGINKRAAPITNKDEKKKDENKKDEKPTIASDKDGEKTEGKDDSDASIPHDYESPVWLVEPYGGSIWAQGTTYVIGWGPNPEPDFAKNINPTSLVDVTLMQGPPDELKTVQTLATGINLSNNMFEWLVPATLAPGTDYSIRVSQKGKLDTYSHYFEIAPAGDARASKSNVGEPLDIPKKDDVPQPLSKGEKGAISRPAAPPNPIPEDKAATATHAAGANPVPAAPTAKPAAAKPVVNAASSQNANFLAFAMTLFGAVYFL